MATRKTKLPEASGADEIKALKKEVAALKKKCEECCSAPAASEDPRVSKLIEALRKANAKWALILENAGL